MNTVTIDGSKTSVYDATLWCQEHFGHNGFDLDNMFPNWDWKFRFNRSEDAMHFALRWC